MKHVKSLSLLVCCGSIVVVALIYGQRNRDPAHEDTALGRLDETSATERAAAFVLFQRVIGRYGFDGDAQRQAAEELTVDRAGEQWVILLLIDETSMYPLEYFDDWQQDARSGQIYPRMNSIHSFVARIIQNLPATTSPEVLWALTYRLDDERSGDYGETVKTGVFSVAQVDKTTGPLRDVARDALVRILDVDHGYEVGRWRETILDRTN